VRREIKRQQDVLNWCHLIKYNGKHRYVSEGIHMKVYDDLNAY